MEKLVFATNNAHKLEEVRAILEPLFTIVSLAEIDCVEDIPETADTLEGNALLKANYVYEKFGFDCFADDTGMEVDALGGEPGVYSARYAGEEHNSHDNMRKVLSLLGDNENRSACFRTVITLIQSGEIHNFEGKITGTIAPEARGESGFGYDPIFVPDGYDLSFAQLGAEEKNQISHRALAVRKLVDYLQQKS